MAAGIRAAKSGPEAQRQALEAEVAGLNQRIRDQDRHIGYLADQLATAEAAQPTAAPAQATPPAPATPPPPDPAAVARDREDTELSGLAIVARENPQGGSRRVWRQAVDQLGRHLAPDATVAEQQQAALRDPRGQAFLEALQSCRN